MADERFEDELRRAIVYIDRFVEDSQFKLVQVFSTGCLDVGVASDIKNLPDLYDKLETKYSPRQSCVLLRHILVAACIKDVYVSKLPLVDKNEEFNSSDNYSVKFPNFSLQEMALHIIKQLGRDWVTLRNKLCDDERGTAAANIKSAPQLFMCLLKSNTLSRSNTDQARQFLISKLLDIGRHDIAQSLTLGSSSGAVRMSLDVKSTHSEKFSAACTLSIVEVDNHSIQDLSESCQLLLNNGRQQEKQRKGPRHLCITITSIIIAVFLVLVYATTAIAVALAFKPYGTNGDIKVYNWSFLATGRAIDICLYGTADISYSASEDRLIDFYICQIPCSHAGYPSQQQLTTSLIEHNDTLSVMYNKRYFVPLSDENSDVVSSGIYLLRNSNITVRVNLIDDESDIKLNLYLFNNINNCDKDIFSLNVVHSIQEHTFSNSSTEFFFSVEHDDFYCALWEMESPELNVTSATVNYSTSTTVVAFDVSSYRNSNFCSRYIEKTVHLRFSGITCTKQQNICLILSLDNPDTRRADIGVTIHPLRFRSLYVLLCFTCGFVVCASLLCCVVCCCCFFT